MRKAVEALERNRPWHATELVAPLLRDSARRTPEVVLLAARAAATYKGWSRVEELLRPEEWLDQFQDGEGRLLLARAAFELRRPDAVHQAVLTLDSRKPSNPGPKKLHLARVLERAGSFDAAYQNYIDASTVMPELADWLRLRAARISGDSARRAGLYALILNPAARAQVQHAEVAALERTRKFDSAADAYVALGEPVSALRMRLLASNDSMHRAAARKALFEIVRAGTRHSRSAMVVLDSAFPTLSMEEELMVGRAAAASGLSARAVKAFSRVPRLSAEDRMLYGKVLSQLGRDREAVAQFSSITLGALAPQAGYSKARSLLRAGDGTAARAQLDEVLRLHATDASAAASALYLRADLATDDSDDARARSSFLTLAQRYPRSSLAPQARYRAALIAFVSGDSRVAATEFDSLAAMPKTSETMSATYWAGRAWLTSGDTAAARLRWQQAIERDRYSYYAMLAARRLGQDPPAPGAASDTFQSFPDVDATFARAKMLSQLGLDEEAGLEYQHLANESNASADRLLSLAAEFAEAEMASRAAALARRAIALGAPHDARTYRLLYPLPYEDVLVREATQQGLDVALVAALIRQESGFDPRALSHAGARGLMQIMPVVGKELAQAHRFAAWDAALLFQAEVSLELGTSHLAALLKTQPDLGRALAAYNAGASRVRRWSSKAGVDDPEVFVERIPFVETRDYVRIVQRNVALYRALYPTAGAAESAR